MPFDEAIRRMAEAWRNSSERPHATAEVLSQWDELLDAWIQNADLPLLLRVSKGSRGEVLHHVSGRQLVCTDNAPANWALSSALHGRTPVEDDIGRGLGTGQIPIAFALKAAERAAARYKGTQRTKMDPPNLNSLGWTICHVIDVGLKERTAVTALPLERLVRHFRLFMHPRNMFVMPKRYAGIGETPIFHAVFHADPCFDGPG